MKLRFPVLALHLCLLLTLFNNSIAASKKQVIEIIATPARGERVLVVGRFVQMVNYETFLFKDSTGKIEVIVGEDDRIPERLFDPAYEVVLKGEIGSGYLESPVIHFGSVTELSHDPGYVPEVATEPQFGTVTELNEIRHRELTSIFHDPGNLRESPSDQQFDTVTELEETSCQEITSVAGKESSLSIATVLNRRCFGESVSLTGTFVQQVNYETLLFRDQSGEIEVVFQDDDMRLIKKDEWQIPYVLEGEVAKGYRGSAVIAFEGGEHAR